MDKEIKKLKKELNQCQQINKKLKESEEKLFSIFNSTRDGIAVIDKTGKLISINKSLVELGGYTEKEIVGKRIKALKMFRPQDLVKMLATFAQRLLGKNIPPYEVEAKTKDGRKKYIEIQGSLLKIKNKIIGDVAVLRDISDRKKTEEDLKNKNRELEKFNKLAVGRELRIIELKKKIKELEEKLSK